MRFYKCSGVPEILRYMYLGMKVGYQILFVPLASFVFMDSQNINVPRISVYPSI